MTLVLVPGHAISLIGGHGLTVPVPLVQTIELLRCEIAGTGHHCDEETGHRLINASVLALVREPDNEHDEDAIAVHLEGQRVGYIPRQHNTVLARLLDAGKCMRARVEQVSDRDVGAWLEVRVVVEMEG
jgi:hypothetical protein